MSKLIDKLNLVSQGGAEPLGFRTTPSASPKPKMLLIASFAQSDTDSLADYTAGADAGLLHISTLSSGAKALQKMCQAVSDIPWGGWLKEIGRGEIKQMVKAGCDFIVFPAASTPLAMLQNEEVGRILEVEPSLTEGLLRTVNELPVDAVLVGSEGDKDYSLTWHHLMLFQRFANLLAKPLLVSMPAKVTDNELRALWEAGVDGVIVETGAGQPGARLKELRLAIDKLTLPSPRKRGKIEALVPPTIGRTELPAEEEEEAE